MPIPANHNRPNYNQPSTYSDEYARLHVHEYHGLTSCDQGHSHMYSGVSGLPIPYGQSHIHEIRGLTTFDSRHHHAYYAYTGPEIELSSGKHTHYIAFRTSYNSGHDHRVEDYVQATPEEAIPTPYGK